MKYDMSLASILYIYSVVFWKTYLISIFLSVFIIKQLYLWTINKVINRPWLDNTWPDATRGNHNIHKLDWSVFFLICVIYFVWLTGTVYIISFYICLIQIISKFWEVKITEIQSLLFCRTLRQPLIKNRGRWIL